MNQLSSKTLLINFNSELLNCKVSWFCQGYQVWFVDLSLFINEHVAIEIIDWIILWTLLPTKKMIIRIQIVAHYLFMSINIIGFDLLLNIKGT